MILSVCIPSYNRFEKLKETVGNILKAKSDEFEVVIVDNCSPRDIRDYISIDDPRLRIIKRDKPVYGVKNVGDSILWGRGEFSLLLLDKDTIIADGLDIFIESLKNSDVMGGYCELNSKENNIEIVEKNTIEYFGYLSKHPSGNFYKIGAIRKYIESKSEVLEKDPFPFDIYLAYCASLGKMMYYDKPCVCSILNDLKEDDSRGSLTFNKDVGNMYYFPKNRIEEFKTYISCLNEIEIEKSERTEICTRLYKRTLLHVTKEYRNIMNNPEICKHYHHETEKIGLFKMMGFVADLRKAFYDTDCKNITKKDKKLIEKKLLKKALRSKSRGKNG